MSVTTEYEDLVDIEVDYLRVRRDAKARLDAEDAAVEPLNFMSLDDLIAMPAPEPLIEHVLSMGKVAMLSGKYGSGKSFVALDWAACIATGLDWHGKRVTQGKVLYIVAEGASGMGLRVQAWEKANATKIPRENFTVLAEPVQLGTPRAELLKKACADGNFALLIIDTQARCTVGVNENDAGEMGVIANYLGEVAAVAGTAVLDVHHDGKQATLRGSTAIPGASDSILLMEQDAGGILSMVCEKQKDMEPTPTMHFVLKTIDLGFTDKFGNQVTSAVLVVHDGPVGAEDTKAVRDEEIFRMLSAGLNQSEVARQLKIDRSTVSRAVNRSKPRF